MKILKGILTELRERRLWPVAVALLAGLVAVPVLLTKSPSTTASSQVPGAGVSGTSGHTISVRLAGGAQAALRGGARDPFKQHGSAVTTPAGTALPSVGRSISAGGGVASVAAGSGGTSSAPSSAGKSGVGSGSSAPSLGTTTSGGGGSVSAPAPSTRPAAPVAPKKPAPAGLTSTQSYQVELQLSNSSGGLDLIDSVARLSPIPSASQPLLVELGVEQGGSHVLFAVQPGTVPSGAGSCIPGPIDCEILSLSPDQTETVSTGSGATVTQFAVTGISAQNHASVAAANEARNAVSAAGAKLITNSPLTALSLFQYEPSVGAVVDLRNLTVGGN
jgi:hypothetical protein